MGYREQIPIDHGFDHSVALLLEGYQFISNRRHRFQSDIFETRLLGGKKAICIAGADAAMVFFMMKKNVLVIKLHRKEYDKPFLVKNRFKRWTSSHMNTENSCLWM